MIKWTIIMMLGLFSQLATAQHIEWKYIVNAPVSNIPADYWFDEAGNGYFNIRKQNPKHNNQFDRSLYLLKLDQSGKFKGSTYVNNCTSNALLLPFGEDQLLSSGYNCDSDTSKNVVDSRVFDYVGNVLAKGRGFKGNYFASIQTEKGYTFLSKPTRNFSYSYISMGHIDHDFTIRHDTVSLQEVEREGLGIVNAYITPMLMEDKSWVVPMNYGEVSGSRIGVDHGTVLGIKDAKLQWSYPDTLSAYKLKYISAHKNKVALYMRKSRNYDPRLIVLMDQEGHELDHFYFRPGFTAKDLLLTEEHIILLSSHKMVYYDYQGNVVSEFDFNHQNYSRPRNMKVDKAGNIYFVTTKYGQSVIVKIGFENPTLEKPAEENIIALDTIKEASLSISSAHFKKVSDQTLSVSVFPNPASVYINFVLKENLNFEAPFIIQIFDASGKPMHEDKFEGNSYELFLDKFISGSYIYRIIDTAKGNTEFVSGSFIKVEN